LRVLGNALSMAGLDELEEHSQVVDQSLQRRHGRNAVQTVRNRTLPVAVLRQTRLWQRLLKLMLPRPTAHQLEELAEEARVRAEQMRDPDAKRIMVNLALSYERLAMHARLREENQGQTPNRPA
jgi:hypothetical protein